MFPESVCQAASHNFKICNFLLTTFPFDTVSEEIPSSYRVHIWYGETRMAGLQSGEGLMMIDSVVWAQYINVTDSHAAIATAALTALRSDGKEC